MRVGRGDLILLWAELQLLKRIRKNALAMQACVRFPGFGISGIKELFCRLKSDTKTMNIFDKLPTQKWSNSTDPFLIFEG